MEKPDGDMRASGGVRLTKLFDECPSTDPFFSYQADIREWAMGYLAAPHPDLGRNGAVCPFTASSIHKELFWVGCLYKQDTTVEDIESALACMAAEFFQLPPTEGSDALLKTVIILFPAVTAYSVIDEAQRRLKKKFVPMGLMIGQFYPGCEEPGIRNPAFRPLQSPVALLAIRNMVNTDFPFLAAKAEWMEKYLKKFAPDIPADVRSMMAARLGLDAEHSLTSDSYTDQ